MTTLMIVNQEDEQVGQSKPMSEDELEVLGNYIGRIMISSCSTDVVASALRKIYEMIQGRG